MKVPWTERPWKTVLVYGLGLSGLSALAFLRRRGVDVVAVDRRPAQELGPGVGAQDPGVEWRLGAEPDRLPAGVDGVVLSPGVPMDRPLVRAAREGGLPVVAEVELAFPFLNGPVVAITGTNGKSTTTALLGTLLEACGVSAEVCGNIGQPLTSRVDGPPGRVFVVELSSFQLEAVVSFRADSAALLNLAPDHMDRYDDLASYAAAKARIFAHQGADDLAVVNADDPGVLALARRTISSTGARRRLFSRCGTVEDGCYLEGNWVVEIDRGRAPARLFCTSELRISGLHNLENAMAAALLARAHGARPQDLAPGLGRFHGLPHRLERVRERCGVTWYDDSKGTNLDATVKSLEGFSDGSVHLILGGRAKGTDPTPLRDRVVEKARRVYLIGEAGPELGRALGDAVESEELGTLERAVAAAARRSRPGEVVLLSPACASFDQFRDFAHRGDCFKALVRALPEENHG